MTFFHLADLHIGKTVNGLSLLEDQRHILRQILRLAGEHRPDAIVMAGDIYDRPQPSAEAVALYDDLLTELAALNIPALIISGNHDSPERLGFAGRLVESRGIHIHSVYDGTLRTVDFTDAFGTVSFHLLPFVRPASVRPFFPEAELAGYPEALAAALQGTPQNPARRNVLVAHQFVLPSSGEPERSDSETEPVGGLNGVDAGLFSAFDYVALGHLHRPQAVGRPEVRYAGSPLKYSFSECLHKKAVGLVELGEKGSVHFTSLPLVPLRDMRRIAGPLEELLRPEVAAAANPEDYLHVTLTDEGEVPDAMARLRRVYPNVMELAFDNRRTRAASSLAGEAPVERRTPLELLEDFFAEQNGRPPQPAQLALAQSLLAKEGEP